MRVNECVLLIRNRRSQRGVSGYACFRVRSAVRCGEVLIDGLIDFGAAILIEGDHSRAMHIWQRRRLGRAMPTNEFAFASPERTWDDTHARERIPLLLNDAAEADAEQIESQVADARHHRGRYVLDL